jgi:hypothetical protein
MKTLGCLMVAAVLASLPLNALGGEKGFIRKPGRYFLDRIGSTLVITKQPAGSWSLKASWRSGDATSGIEPDESLIAEGWFVFIEKPTRLWVFNGVDGVCLLSHSDKETGVTHVSRANLMSCPRAFWDALPENVRAMPQGSRRDLRAEP